MSSSEFFHDPTDSVRFWVQIDGNDVGASVSRNTLHFHFAPNSTGEDPMATFRTHLAGLEDAVRRRVGKGSIEPVIIRDSDLRI
jgi:hypothetical protein